jgi:hypothetical protein
MATGRNMQLTKQVGEYLVSAELCRNGWVSTTFTGNIPDFDIIAINEQFRTVLVQVKTIRKGSWQFDGRKFLKIKVSGGFQNVEEETVLPNQNIVCVLVKLNGQSRDEYYVCTMKNLQKIIHQNYAGWLSKHGGKRPRKAASTHCTVSSEQLKSFENNWSLLAEVV